jgi:hypothetical protein
LDGGASGADVGVPGKDPVGWEPELGTDVDVAEGLVVLVGFDAVEDGVVEPFGGVVGEE